MGRLPLGGQYLLTLIPSPPTLFNDVGGEVVVLGVVLVVVVVDVVDVDVDEVEPVDLVFTSAPS